MASFSKFFRVRKGGEGESFNIASNKSEGAAPHAVALYFPGNLLLILRVAMYTRLVKRKEQVLYLIELFWLEHYSA